MNKLNIDKIRQDFVILNQKCNSKPLSYLDSGATTLKPKSVVDAVNNYNSIGTANIHRGLYALSEKATNDYENTRLKVQKFLNANLSEEIIFTSGTTGALNMVALGWAQVNLQAGDEIIITEMEHHSNIVPWQMLCQKIGSILKVIPIDNHGDIVYAEFQKLLNSKTKLLSITHTSNALGTINPVKKMIAEAKKYNVVTLVDAAQAVAHNKVDVKDLDCDMLAFSGHKLLAPTGVGVLYGRIKILEQFQPFIGGGDMIDKVSFAGTTYADLPARLEAGTPPIAQVIALGTAIDYILDIGFDAIADYETNLLKYATKELLKIEGLKIIGTAPKKASIISFVLDNIHPHDLAQMLDQVGVACRTGHHCCQPIMNHFNILGTTRVSMAFYNNRIDIDNLINGIKRAKDFLL